MRPLNPFTADEKIHTNSKWFVPCGFKGVTLTEMSWKQLRHSVLASLVDRGGQYMDFPLLHPPSLVTISSHNIHTN